MTQFHIVARVVVFLGAQLKFGLAGDIADVLMGIMALINLPVIPVFGTLPEGVKRLPGSEMHRQESCV